MPTFDIVSKLDPSEVDNAIQNLKREISQRYDFKNSNSQIEFEKDQITITTDDDYKLTQLQEMLKVQITKRGIDAMDYSTNVFYSRSINNPLISTKLISQGKKERLFFPCFLY